MPLRGVRGAARHLMWFHLRDDVEFVPPGDPRDGTNAENS
jgi:hypothetical protein